MCSFIVICLTYHFTFSIVCVFPNVCSDFVKGVSGTEYNLNEKERGGGGEYVNLLFLFTLGFPLVFTSCMSP